MRDTVAEKKTTVSEKKKRRRMADNSRYKDYVAGLLAGVATVIIGHPFDTVKVKLQKHNTDTHGIKYKSGLHCTARILKTEGAYKKKTIPDRDNPIDKSGGITLLQVRGLYRGATSSFVGVAFESSLLFGIYSQTKQSLEGGVQSSKPRSSIIIPSAAFGGGIISFVLCPSELVKVQGTDSLIPSSSRYTGPLDCVAKTVKTNGITGIFRGGFTTLLRESIGNAVFFSTYEHIRYYMHLQLKDTPSNHSNLVDVGIGILSGGLSGIGFWAAVLPLDVAKTIIQTAPENESTRNPFQILKSIYRRSGLKGCYTGLGPTIVRAFPANAAAIVTWELAVKMLGIKRE